MSSRAGNNQPQDPGIPRMSSLPQSALSSPRGSLLLAGCRSGNSLAGKVHQRYQELVSERGTQVEVPLLEEIDFQFSDGETCVRLDQDVNGRDVFLFQALHNPLQEHSIDHNYLALMIAARTFREWGANHVTAVVPYLAYTRQDKPTRYQREPTTVELMADLSLEAGLDRLVTWHPHMDRVHGYYGSIPVNALSSLALFQDQFQKFAGREDVIAVAPDSGALKFIMDFARSLNISSAVAAKYRPRPEKAVVSEIMGDFEGKKTAIVLDDMINTGGTMTAAVKKLVRDHGIQEVYLGVSHHLGSDKALERLQTLHQDYRLREIVVTDSVPQREEFISLPFTGQVSLAGPLCTVIDRIHHHQPVGDWFFQQKNQTVD